MIKINIIVTAGKKNKFQFFAPFIKTSGCFLCFAAWMGAFGRGHVWSQAEPTAACSANRLGGAAGQSRTDFLRQSRNQNHPVAPTHSAVREVASVLYCKLASSASGCGADRVCSRMSPTGTVMWKGREGSAAVLAASTRSSHADRSLKLRRATPESLPM